jgi:hypothetical protein
MAENDVGQDAPDQFAPESALRVFVAIDGVVAGVIDSLAAIFLSGHAITSPDVRILTPFFNIYGTISLIGGALWSSWVFWRKRIMPYRAIGNVLIALGAIVGGGISALSRFGALSLLYIGELTSLLLVFAGFVLATRSVQSNRTADTSSERLRSDA